MKHYSLAKTLSVGVLVGGIGAAAAVAACSSSTSTGGGSGGDGGTNNGQPGSCANPTLPVSFTPMYSAFVTDSTTHQFQIPAIVDGVSGLTWSSSEPSKVKLTADPTSGGVMITVQGAGTISVFATAADGTCGASVLTVTSATENDWAIGNARYNDGNSIHFGRRDGGGADGGDVTPNAGPACTSCHGPTATSGPFKDVAHTPEQTGGFSDKDLIDIVVNGVVPDGGYFDPNVIIPDAGGDPAAEARAYRIWQNLHQWNDITPDQQRGIVVYLRSITPAPQDGTSNFGGPRDGGRRDGGRRDGGGGPPGNDSGSAGDAADQ